MRSESEITWIRVKNNVGQATRVSDWHAIVPGLGSDAPPPGVACGTALSGSRQTISHTGLRTIDGAKHAKCLKLAADYVKDIDPSPGPREPDEPDKVFAPPGTNP